MVEYENYVSGWRILIIQNALILFGSPHENGKTTQLLKYYTDTLENFEIKMVDLFGLKFEFCKDCGFCKNNSNCIYDDLDFLEDLYRETDLLIIASPIHNSSLSAPLKALNDRTQKYYNARFSRNIKPYFAKPKDVCLILTADSLNFSDVVNIMSRLERTFSITNAKFCTILTNFGI